MALTTAKDWLERAKDDLKMRINMSDGRLLSYDELAKETGNRYADLAVPDVIEQKVAKIQRALDHLAADIEQAGIDAMIIIGDDQEELYRKDNMPAVGLYYGDEVVTHKFPLASMPSVPDWLAKIATAYGADTVHRFPGHRTLALALIESLLENSVDIAACGSVPDPEAAGFGHAFGFVINRLFRKPIPVVPLMLNTYYPPNVPSAARYVAIGRALRKAVEAAPGDLRVGVIASGGLSHFFVDEELDRKVLAAVTESRADDVATLPRGALNSGSSEILNWVTTLGAVEHLPNRWVDYIPGQRTAAGTGCGMAFTVWLN